MSERRKWALRIAEDEPTSGDTRRAVALAAAFGQPHIAAAIRDGVATLGELQTFRALAAEVDDEGVELNAGRGPAFIVVEQEEVQAAKDRLRSRQP